MKHLFIISLLFTLLLSSCASSYNVGFLCEDKDVEMYIDDEYIGKGQISYTVAKGVTHITVSCRKDGIEIYQRKYHVKGQKNVLFDVIISKDYRYSFENK